MVGLLDIAPLKANVNLRGTDYPVVGINVEGIAYLLRRFPVVANVLGNAEMRANLSAATFMALAPEIIDAIIATGLGHPNSPEHEKALHNLSFDEQLECIEKILEVTMPRGLRPFVETIERLGAKAGASGWVPDTSSDGQSTS
jgi:hypothetical protein